MEENLKEDLEAQNLIIRKYQQYLRLEKGLSPNTYEAYLTDLQKLLNYLRIAGIDIKELVGTGGGHKSCSQGEEDI